MDSTRKKLQGISIDLKVKCGSQGLITNPRNPHHPVNRGYAFTNSASSEIETCSPTTTPPASSAAL
jgi:hypothetical protein